jgi:hypothetical protein
MKPAPINLLDYFATEIALTANPEFDANHPLEFRAGDFVAEPTVLRSPSGAIERRWQVSLEIRHSLGEGVNYPYSYRVRLVGFFRAEDWLMAESEERTVRIHGASVLYGMAREIVRALTGRGPHRAVLIPTVSFYDPPPAVKG